MPDYRLYLFVPLGRAAGAVELRCSDDAQALRMLKAHAAWHPILESRSDRPAGVEHPT